MAGLLDTIKDKAKQVYQQGLLNQVITNPASVGQEFSQLFDPSYMSQVKPMSQETAFDVALSAPMMAGITAYHGSPFKFDKFDVQKSGTGSGKNLFGEGIYTAEFPKEAKSYMTAGTAGTVTYNGKLMNRDSPRNSKDSAAYALYLAKGNIDDAIRSGLSTPEAINKIKYEKIKPTGNFYKVDIPDELIPSMIKYGEPISSQHQNVINLAEKNKDVLNKILDIQKIKNPDINLNSIYDLPANKLFKALGGVGKAEKTMLESGVGGVRYNSPVEGMNTVVFDPNVIKILERNGILMP
jgi:hypothetical protein